MTSTARPRCLVCCGVVDTDHAAEYHPRCSRALFDRAAPPVLDFGMADIERIAREEISRRVAVTGVQRKISLDMTAEEHGRPRRLTFVGLWGRFVLKPPAPDYREMPELEHATMHLAAVAGIDVARHALVRLASGELAYIARRFDRFDGRKLALEDMCQLTGKLTEDKYRSSMEQVGKAILRWSSNPGLDATRLLDVAVFSFLTGNADMHLKNFSLLTDQDGTIRLAPAYDLLATKLLLVGDPEEMALSLNGKRARLQRSDFVALGNRMRVAEKAVAATFERFAGLRQDLLDAIDASFLSPPTKEAYRTLLADRCERLEIGSEGQPAQGTRAVNPGRT